MKISDYYQPCHIPYCPRRGLPQYELCLCAGCWKNVPLRYRRLWRAAYRRFDRDTTIRNLKKLNRIGDAIFRRACWEVTP